MKTTTLDVPLDFQAIFTSLVKALQPRYLDPDAVEVYWAVLAPLPMEALRQSAEALKLARFFPNTGDWFLAAKALADTWTTPPEGSRRLEELDGLDPRDPERDEVCKGLSDAEGDQLMARYGYALEHGRWIDRSAL